MKLKTSILILLLVGCAHVESNKLFYDSVKTNPDEGKPLNMKFKEISREEKYSIVEVKYISGASVPSTMFIVKGMYEIAKLRGSNYFINLKEWKNENGDWMYKVGFTNNDNIDLSSYFGEDLKNKEKLKFLSVSDYKLIWD